MFVRSTQYIHPLLFLGISLLRPVVCALGEPKSGIDVVESIQLNLPYSRQSELITTWANIGKENSLSEQQYVSLHKEMDELERKLEAHKNADSANLSHLAHMAENAKKMVLDLAARSRSIKSRVWKDTESEVKVKDPFQRKWLLETGDDLRYRSGYFSTVVSAVFDNFMELIAPETRPPLPKFLLTERGWSAHKRRMDANSCQKLRQRLQDTIWSVKEMVAELNFSKSKHIELETLVNQSEGVLDPEKNYRLSFLRSEKETHAALCYDLDERAKLLRNLYLRDDVIEEDILVLLATKHDPFSSYEKDIEIPSSSARRRLKTLQDNARWRYQWAQVLFLEEFNKLYKRNWRYLKGGHRVEVLRNARSDLTSGKLIDEETWKELIDVDATNLLRKKPYMYLPGPEHLRENSRTLDSLRKAYLNGEEGFMIAGNASMKLGGLPLILLDGDKDLFEMAIDRAEKWFRSQTHSALADIIMQLELEGKWEYNKNPDVKKVAAKLPVNSANMGNFENINTEILAERFEEKLWGTMSDPEKAMFFIQHLSDETLDTQHLKDMLEYHVLTLEERWGTCKLLDSQKYVNEQQWLFSVRERSEDHFLEMITLEAQLKKKSELVGTGPDPRNQFISSRMILRYIMKKDFQILEREIDSVLKMIGSQAVGSSTFQDLLLMFKMKKEDIDGFIEYQRNPKNQQRAVCRKVKNDLRNAIEKSNLRLEFSVNESCISVAQILLHDINEEIEIWKQHENQSAEELRKQVSFFKNLLRDMGYPENSIDTLLQKKPAYSESGITLKDFYPGHWA